MNENNQTENRDGNIGETLVEGLVGVGAAWARYGLTIGRSSLEASAKTLESTADLLGKLASSFEKVASESRHTDRG